VDTSGGGAGQDAKTVRVQRGRLRSMSRTLIFDVAAPLAAYYLLRSAGLTAVEALLVSGVFPALGVGLGALRNHRLDAIGALVLVGILVGTVLGLVGHSARLLLIEGSVPTGIFGVVCLGSLGTRRPLMFAFALEFIGPDTGQGRQMVQLWQYEGFRRVWRTITTVGGCVFLFEAALRVVIVYNTSTGTALALSKVTPFVFSGLFGAWTFGYGTYQKRKGERIAAAAGVTLPGRPQP
jgi:intracellular septation protein A